MYPIGMLEDMFVQVRNMVFPTYFYIFDMEDDSSLRMMSIFP